MYFRVSENESQILGYRVARGDLNSLKDIEQLRENLRDCKVDVLKLSIVNSPQDLYLTLDQLKLSYYVLGMVVEYRSNFVKHKLTPYRNKSIDFIEYAGEDHRNFEQLIAKIFAGTPTSYYTNPGLFHVYNKEKQLRCLAAYVNTLNKSNFDNYYSHLIYYKEKPAGFITSYKEGQGGAATYAGLLPEFQGKGLYIDLVNFIQNHGKSIGQKWGTAYAQIQNTVVQKTFQRQGLSPSGYVLNIHINCFFGKLHKTANQ